MNRFSRYSKRSFFSDKSSHTDTALDAFPTAFVEHVGFFSVIDQNIRPLFALAMRLEWLRVVTVVSHTIRFIISFCRPLC